MENKAIKTELLIYLGLFLLSFFIVFTSCLNPFGLRGIDDDTSVFLTIAQGITRGQIPYRDFVDNKGPVLYLINALGMILGNFIGVWIIELVFMCVTVFFAYKTALFFENKYIAFGGVVCSLIVFQTFFYEVAGSEEYALPFMMISKYIFVKHYFIQKETPVHELISLGICFAITFFLRTNMFPLWLGFCAIITMESIHERKILPILKYILFFLAGILIIAIPIFLYLYHNNAFNDYIYQVFTVGNARAFNGFSFVYFVESFFIIIGKNYCYIPLLLYSAWLIKNYKNVNRNLIIGLLVAYLLTVFFLAVIRTNYDHYNMVLLPYLVPAFSFCVKYIFIYFSNIKYKNIISVLFLCIVFAMSLFYWSYCVLRVITDDSRISVMEAGKIIDLNTGKDDTIISLGNDCDIYLFSKRKPASRYIYQTSGARYDKNAQNEFIHDIKHNKPKIISIQEKGGHYNYLPEWYSPVYCMIAEEYQLLSSDNGYFLFIRN